MPVTRRPPHRSVLAALLHTAPANGLDVKPLGRERMDYTARGHVFSYQAVEPSPRQSMSLASAQQGVTPRAAHLAEKPRQSAHVTRHRMIIEVPANRTAQPSTHNRHRFVSPSHQRFANVCQRCSHPFLDRQPDELETATRLTTAVREAEKVECFRPSHSPLPALLHSESSKADQSRLSG